MNESPSFLKNPIDYGVHHLVKRPFSWVMEGISSFTSKAVHTIIDTVTFRSK